MRIECLAAFIAIQAVNCVIAAPPPAQPKAKAGIRETRNADGTYTLELPQGRFKRVTDPQAFQAKPPRQDRYGGDKYLTSDETEAGNRAIARQQSEQKSERARNDAMEQEWQRTVKEAEEASKRSDAQPPSQEDLKNEYDAAYKRGYADARRWVDAIKRDIASNANQGVIEQKLDALNTVVETYASQHQKVQRYVEEVVQAYGPEKRNKHALVLARTRGGYEGAKAAAGRQAR